MKNILLLSFIFAFIVVYPTYSSDRTWTSADGSKTFDARLHSFNPETGIVVVIQKGRKVTFHEDKLSAADRGFLASTSKSSIPLRLAPRWQETNENVTTDMAPEAIAAWSKILKDAQEDGGFPAIGGILIIDGEIKTPLAFGLRKYKGKEAVTTKDKWHIGSLTKSMTGTLAATFVEEGTLKWTTTVGEILGEDVDMRRPYEAVTLKMLITNRSGLPTDVPKSIWADIWSNSSAKGDIVKMRKEFVEEMLSVRPSSEPGTNFEYSNSGFVVAGAMMEKITGKSWETLMAERIFQPLGMSSAGFGCAASLGKEDQPWAHKSLNEPVEPGLRADNPRVIGPAGTVHVSLVDFAKYMRMHLLHEVGPVLKKKESFTTLQTPSQDNNGYAGGWFVIPRTWANGNALNHSGTNTMNYFLVWASPNRKFASIVATNCSSDKVDQLLDGVAGEAISVFLK